MTGKADKGGALSRSARSIVDAARDADAPTAADRERVKKALAVAIAASAVTAGAATASAAGAKALATGAGGIATTGAATTGAVTGAAASTVGGLTAGGLTAGGLAAGGLTAGGATGGTVLSAVLGASLFTKVVLVVAAVGVTSSAIVATERLTRDPVASEEPGELTRESADAHPEPPATIDVATDGIRLVIPEDLPSAEDVVPAEEVAPAPEVLDEPVEPALGASARHAAPRAAPRAEPVVEEESSRLEAELAVLRPARVGPPAEMLERVTEYDRRYPEGGIAASVRDDMRRNAIRTLCAQGDDAVTAYLEAHPTSPHAAAIRSACP